MRVNTGRTSAKITLFLVGGSVILIAFIAFRLFFATSPDVLANGTYQDYFVSCEKTDDSITIESSSMGITHSTTRIIFECTATSPQNGKTYKLNVEPGKGNDVYMSRHVCSPGFSVKGTVIVNDREYDSIVFDGRMYCEENPFLNESSTL